MSFLKGNKSKKVKSAPEVVRGMREALSSLEKANGNEKVIAKVRLCAVVARCNESDVFLSLWHVFAGSDHKQAGEDVSKQAAAMKVILHGDSEHEPSPDQYQQLATEVMSSGLIARFITNLSVFEFEVGRSLRPLQPPALTRGG